ncbi:MAG: hypothetical protein AMJ93_05725 [Anaerolineae bacterium SM23_84]|nr:MAG: hypothetical protein AMJ93_05725 [Anaerolineae bacterium SM23_84]
MSKSPKPSGGEEKTDSEHLDVPPEPAADEALEAQEERQPTSLLDMLFREAEVIARNLKESGTRR